MIADFCCGGECGWVGGGNAPNPEGKRHWRIAGGTQPTLVPGRTGGSAFRFDTTAAQAVSYNRRDLVAGGTTRWKRGYLRFNSFPNLDADVAAFFTAAGLNLKVRYRQATQDIIAVVDTATGTAVATPVVLGQWYMVEVYGDVSGANSTLHMYVDGVDKGTATKAIAASTFTEFRVGGQCSGSTGVLASVDWDDLITGTNIADFPVGPGQIIGKKPGSDKAHNFNAAGDFKYNNSVNVPVGATDTYTYINHGVGSVSNFLAQLSTTAGESLRWGLEPITEVGTVHGLEIVSAHHASGPNANKQSLKAWDGATSDLFMADADLSQTTIVYQSKHYAARLGALGALTMAAIAAMELEWSSSFTAPDVADIPFLDGVVFEIDYLPTPGVTVTLTSGVRMGMYVPGGLEGFGKTVLPDDRVGMHFRLGVPTFRVVNPETDTPPSADPTFTAESVIEAARDRHSSFDRSRHPSPILLRRLDRLQRSLLARALQRNHSILVAPHTVPFPLADWDAGYLLPFSFHLMHGGDVNLLGGGRVRFTLVPWGQRHDPIDLYSGWIHGTNIFFRGEASDWTGVESVTLSYVPTVSRLSSLRATLQLPRSSEPVLVEQLAAFMAGRKHTDPQLPPIDEAAFIQRAAEEERDWLSQIAAQRRSQMKQIREVC
jgi:hypothetical protein